MSICEEGFGALQPSSSLSSSAVASVAPGPMTLVFQECGPYSQNNDGDEKGRQTASEGVLFPAHIGISATSSLQSSWPTRDPSLSSATPNIHGAAAVSLHQDMKHVLIRGGQPYSHFHHHTKQSSCAPVSIPGSVIQSVPSTDSVSVFDNLQTHPSDSKASETGFSDYSNSELRSHSATYYIDKPCEDGYNWRKYGQKQVKGSDYPRSYYRCTYRDCPVKKKVERSLEGHITEIIYQGQHNHRQLSSTRQRKNTGILSHETIDLLDVTGGMGSQNIFGKSITCSGTFDQFHNRGARHAILNFSDVDPQIKAEECGNNEHDLKRRRISETGVIRPTFSQKNIDEYKIVIQTRSEVDLLDDGYRWRKYGQKVVKGNSHPRSYYKCTYAGCLVRKHIERAATDPRSVMTTYEGKHNHDVPASVNRKNRMASTGDGYLLHPTGHSLQGRKQHEMRSQAIGWERVMLMKTQPDITSHS